MIQANPVALDQLEAHRFYLVRICGDWFVGGFSEDAGFFHTAGGSNGMWAGWSQQTMIKRGMLEEAYVICEEVPE